MQQLWPAARDKFAEGVIDWDDDSFGVAVMDSTYSYNPTHEFRDDLTGVLGTTTLTNTVSVGNGVCDADDASVVISTPGAQMRSIAIYRDTGNPATDDLIYFASSQTDGVAISRTSDGTNPINLIWSNGTTRIFRI